MDEEHYKYRDVIDSQKAVETKFQCMFSRSRIVFVFGVILLKNVELH